MKKLLFLVLATGLLFNVSCKKENADDETAPEIPPLSTFEMSFSDFDSDTKTANDSTWYWGRAAVQVGVFNYILAVHLAVPVASFKEAFNHEPTYVADSKEWLWKYTVVAPDSSVYTAKLYGKISGTNVNWRMLLSKSGAFSDFEWYTGVSKVDKSAGTWSLNFGPLNKSKFIDIAWSKSTSKEEIKYTNVLSGHDGYGSYINYGITPGAELDAFYDIYLSKENASANIYWSRAYHHGKVKEANFYGDNNFRCWGTDLANTVCE